MLISGLANFRARNVIRDKEGHCIMIKRSNIQEDKTSLMGMCLTAVYRDT